MALPIAGALALLKSPIARWAAGGAVVAVLGVAVYVQTLRLDAAELRQAAAEQRAAAAAAVIQQMQADQALSNRLVAEYAAEIAAHQERYRADHDAILRQASEDCGDDAVCRLALERMRARRGTASDDPSRPARRPD